MAGRSDFQSALPRTIKKLISLSPVLADPHRAGEVRRLFLKAHAWHKQYKNKAFHDDGSSFRDDVVAANSVAESTVTEEPSA